MSGCLLPQQEAPVANTEAIPPNRPPRIIESSAQPSPRMQHVSNGPNCQLEFSVNVEDPDIRQRVQARWYVDYDATTRPDAYAGDVDIPFGDRALREDPAKLTMNLANDANPLHAFGPHMVEVLIHDGALVGRVPQPIDSSTPDGGTSPSYAVTYAWFFIVDSSAACPVTTP